MGLVWVPGTNSPPETRGHVRVTNHWDRLSNRSLLVPFQPLPPLVAIPPWKNPSQTPLTCWPAALTAISPLAWLMHIPARCHRCFCKSHGFWLNAFNDGPSFRRAFTALVGDSPPSRHLNQTLSVGDLHQNAFDFIRRICHADNVSAGAQRLAPLSKKPLRILELFNCIYSVGNAAIYN